MHLSSYVPFFFYELWTKMHKDGGCFRTPQSLYISVLRLA
jgi:hypothetical protein